MAELRSDQKRVLQASGCEVRCDDLSRVLYATDASIYQVEPAAVALPRTAAEAAAVVRAASEAGLSVTPRGAGTGLAGGALGEGVVLDMAQHSRWITDLNVEAQTVRVGPGVVLDQLNNFLAPHGLGFGPDVATSSRATLGGMIANNSSGAHAPVYGATVDHTRSIEVVLADGTVARVGDGAAELAEIRAAVDEIVDGCAGEIAEQARSWMKKRWPGYGFDRYLGRRGDLSRLVSGSEGTLAVIASAELDLVQLPAERGLAVLFFDSVEEALQAAVEVVDLEPAAVEHLDRFVFDETRGQLAFARARALLDLDRRPVESMLLVEFFDQVEDRLRELAEREIGARTLICADAEEQELVWGVRRAGLSLVTACKGPCKPTAGIEDVCVAPERLPEYVKGLREIMAPLGLRASFYGHAASGELHVRPAFDLHEAEGVEAFRQVADQVSDLCRRFGGSLAAEHGVGMARTEYLEDHLGPELVAATGKIKALFDPDGVLNPGKIVDVGRYRIDSDLRLGAGAELVLPFAEVFGFVDKDESFVGNLEQCNGCGGCRKDPPSMCPTFLATGEELMSTRGRANVIRAALEGRFGDRRLAVAELEQALSACLSCKACKKECPSGVDLAMLKAELKHARHCVDGVPLLDRIISSADLLGRLGTAMPRLANAALSRTWARRIMEKVLGIAAERPLPTYASERFDHWFERRSERGRGERGRVILWDDTWVRYHEPHVGRAAVSVLEAAGFEVELAVGRKCCGRPACSRGLLDEVRRLAEHNVGLLHDGSRQPVVFLEPSCYSMFVDEYRHLEIPGAVEIAARCVLFEDLVVDLVAEEPEALSFADRELKVAVHGHCHAKALADPSRLSGLEACVPGMDVDLIATGCCGMAGAFGMETAHQELSHAVAAPLLEAVDNLASGTVLVASGTSCRHQISHLTEARPRHLAEVIADLLRQ